MRCEYLDGPALPASSVQLQRLQRLSQDPSALSELLATLPYFEALELFDMFRKMPRDTYTAAQSMNTPETSSPRSPPSWAPLAAQCPTPMHYTLAGSLLPPASSPMEQELMVRHPIAYPVLMPIAVNSLPLEALLIPRNPEGLGDRLSLNDTAHLELSDTAKKKVDLSDEADDWYKSLLFLEQPHIDLLRQVEISKWTDLPIPNEFAIRVIALYLNNDYPVLPLFNADLFLQDLAQNRPYFCSRLLVSALFAWACVSTPDQENNSKADCDCSKPILPCTPKQPPGVRSFISTLKRSGTSWIAAKLLRYATYPHRNSCPWHL